ncbi:hypothetical protein EGD47_26195 [Salmonella enterica]|nr:hypothetical protein [Salmonella enterica]EBB7650680.1 hypothetical protein [Salmonella enterica]EGR8151002.1 hypothetical protein [Salmonella enterica subsp. enterica serovar Adelaide]EHK3593122.1 hypothetical protein [Salmonella enterica]MJL38199.1 hypothetical protein [Salmonella enterica subsp. enterica serovar Minnesota]
MDHLPTEDGGEFHTPLRGIPRGSALSPLLAAFHLTETANVFSRNRHVTYARYMDDFLILSPTRWHLRRAVRMLNRHFAQAGFEQHPDKTFIGRVEKGFDWMGFWFTEKGCDGVAPRALQHFKDRLRRLYEQVRQWPEDLRHRRMAGYVRAWDRWAASGLLSGSDVNSPIRYRYRRAKQSLVACDLLCVHVEVPFATQSRVIGGPEQAVGVHCGTSDRPTAELATVHVSVRRFRCVATQPVS